MNKNILVTGGAGYIGSHCALNFLEQDIDDIVVFDDLSVGHIETINTLQKIKPFVFIQGDLKNPEDINQVFKKYKIIFTHAQKCDILKWNIVHKEISHANTQIAARYGRRAEKAAPLRFASVPHFARGQCVPRSLPFLWQRHGNGSHQAGKGHQEDRGRAQWQFF